MPTGAPQQAAGEDVRDTPTIVNQNKQKDAAADAPAKPVMPATPPAGMPPAAASPKPATGPAPVADKEAEPEPAAPAEPAPGRYVGNETVGPGAGRARPEPELATQVLARLVSVRRDGTDGEVHEICEEAVDLGRCEGQLTFADDPYLSERHCRFSIKDGAWIVQDLDSVNGVYVRLTDLHELRDGDHLLLGKQVIRFDWLGDDERNLAPAVEHGVMILGSPLRAPWGRLRQMTVAGVARDVHYLYRSKITVGREDGDLIFPDDEFMSRQHLTMSFVGGKVQSQDLGSSNGTFVRVGQKALVAQEMLRIGDQLLRFELA